MLIADFFNSEAGIATAISAGFTILAVIIRHWLQGKVNLIAFSPNSSYFQFAPPEDGAHPIHILSGQVMIQNLGRLPAREVEVVSSGQGVPAGYNLLPPVDHTSSLTESGRWLLKIPFIAPKEVITIQILNGSNIETIRCRDGIAKFVPVIHQRLYPLWFNYFAGLLMVIGFFSLSYWMILAIY